MISRRRGDLVRDSNIPALSAYGMSAGDIPSVVEKAMKANSTKGNPIPLTEGELMGILERAVQEKVQELCYTFS